MEKPDAQQKWQDGWIRRFVIDSPYMVKRAIDKGSITRFAVISVVCDMIEASRGRIETDEVVEFKELIKEYKCSFCDSNLHTKCRSPFPLGRFCCCEWMSDFISLSLEEAGYSTAET